MDSQTPQGRKICLTQWVLVMLMGLFGGIIGGMITFNATSLLEKLPGIAVGVVVGLVLSGIGMSFYMRWKRSRLRS